MPDEFGSESGVQVLRGLRILVAEDEFFVADEIARALAAAGAEVLGPLPDVERALEAVAANPDAAVLDVNLRGTMSWAVADALLARGVPVLLATGYDAGMIPEPYAALPRYEKPVTPKELVRVIAERLRRAG